MGGDVGLRRRESRLESPGAGMQSSHTPDACAKHGAQTRTENAPVSTLGDRSRVMIANDGRPGFGSIHGAGQ